MVKKHNLPILAVAILSTAFCGLADTTVKLLSSPPGQDIVRENGMISLPEKTKSQGVLLVPEGGFEAGKSYEIRFKLAPMKQVAVRTGREFTYLSKNRDGSVRTNQVAESVAFGPAIGRESKTLYGIQAVETTPQVHATQPKVLTLNYVMPEKTFGTMDNVARWQENEALRLSRDLAKESGRVLLAITDAEIQLYANGVFMSKILREGGDVRDLRIQVLPNTFISDVCAVNTLKPGFLPLDLSERANAAGLDGQLISSFPKDTREIEVGGVPFRLSENPKFDAVDLSMSWMETAMRTGYEPTAPSVRWRAGWEKVPLRYQFSVPCDAYDALYVLAASNGKPDTVPRFTAQFYIRGRTHTGGRPIGFASPAVPVFTAEATVANAYPVTSGTGKTGSLHLVEIKLEPGLFRQYSESQSFEMELTKDVLPYRSYPDPIHHSLHGAGLPSAVQVFGITFGRSPLKTTFDPDALGNVWHEGEKASYTVKLENATKSPRQAKLAFTAVSHDRADTHAQSESVGVQPGETKEVRFAFTPKRFGHYDVTLVKEDSGEKKTFTRTLAHLRKRDHKPRGFYDKGMFYGSWMISSATDAKLAAMMGLDSFDRLLPADDPARAMMEQYGMKGFMDGHTLRAHGVIKPDKTDSENRDALMQSLPDLFGPRSAIHQPVFSAILCEPGGVGNGNAGFGEYYGDEPYDYAKLTGRAKERYTLYKKLFLMVRQGILQVSPKTKIMLPNGHWTFAIPFLQDPETRDLFDGVKMDYQFYQRLPEQQMHQCSIHSMFYFWNAWNRYRETPPVLSLGEGPGISQIYPGANDAETAAALQIRAALLMAGYGVQHQHAVAYRLIDSGENHCSGGFLDNEVTLNPHLSYSTFATFSRHTRHALFASYTNPGSFSAYCANFRDSPSGKFFRVIWSIRSTREFIFNAPPEKLTVYDPMDNLVKPEARDGKSVVRVGQIPVYVYGTDETTAVTLGAINPGDSQLGKWAVKIGNAADLFTEQTDDADPPYVEFHPEEIKRFPAKMEVATVQAGEAYGSKALSVTLPKQDVDPNLMPYFTCLKPRKPIPINGKASHILIWVNANSDWGRVVYVLRDAKDKLWYSVGFAGSWNSDDMPGDSVFCFDGWRLLRYELPAHAPWDSFRELGMTRWGSDSKDGIAELPLALEKIFVERRSSVMYGNGAHTITDGQPVLLGDLYVDYVNESDGSAEAVRLSRIRAPQVPVASLPNPLVDLRKSATLPAGRITKVEDPDTWFDGTRGVFTFEMPTNAVGASIWMSQTADGRGALKPGKDLKQSPAQVGGFLADTEFYAFLVWTDKDGRTSVPSDPFKFKLLDHFQHQ